jgi:hypothetical protein
VCTLIYLYAYICAFKELVLRFIKTHVFLLFLAVKALNLLDRCSTTRILPLALFGLLRFFFVRWGHELRIGAYKKAL